MLHLAHITSLHNLFPCLLSPRLHTGTRYTLGVLCGSHWLKGINYKKHSQDTSKHKRWYYGQDATQGTLQQDCNETDKQTAQYVRNEQVLGGRLNWLNRMITRQHVLSEA